VTLRKIYREDWVKPRGALEAVLKGHTNVCYFDGVPVDMGEYNRRINDIIPEALFKLITNPLYYNSLHWQERRRILLNMSGEINDSEIAALNPEFEQLLSSLAGKSLSDFKAKIAAEKAAIKDEYKKLPTKITTVLEGIPQVDDWAAIEQEIKEKQSRLDEIDTAIADTTKGSQLVFDKIQQIQGEINKLKTKRLTAVQTAKAAEKDRVFDANQQRRELENEISGLQREIKQVNENAGNLKKERDSVDQKIKSLTTKVDNLREQWHKENAKEYVEADGCFYCPAFGHTCTDATAIEKHESNKQKAREAFNTSKAEKLAQINSDGQKILRQIDELKKEFEAIEKDVFPHRN
jgi:chromosome segregation ATPase